MTGIRILRPRRLSAVSTQHKRWLLVSLPLILLSAIVLSLVEVKDLCAHAPHDAIDALELSPMYDRDQTLFVIIVDRLFRSIDGGHSWQELVNGLDHRRLLTSVVVSPSYGSDANLFVSSDGDGIYRSKDGGESWAQVNNGLDTLRIGLLSIHPDYRSNGMVWASGIGGGLYRTENGGDAWRQVIDDSIEITAVAFSVSPRETYAFAGDRRGILRLSTDGGQTWNQTTQISDGGPITAIAASPAFASDHTLFVGTKEDGIWKSTDGGVSFQEANTGLGLGIRGKYGTFRTSREGPAIRRTEKAVLSIALSPDFERDALVFASMWNEAVFRSEDAGRTWKRYPLGLTCNYQADSSDYKSPHFRDIRISNAYATDETVFLAGYNGLFKSTDGGRHWDQLQTVASPITGLTSCSGDASTPSLAFSTGGDGVYTAMDGGITWTIGNVGLASPDVTDIVYPSSCRPIGTAFSTSVTGYFHKSTDGGSHWSRIPLGGKRQESLVSYALSLVESVLRKLGLPRWLLSRLFGGSELQTIRSYTMAVSPDFVSDNTVFLGTRNHGLLKSTDGGLTAYSTWDGAGHSIMDLVISPGFASDRTLFAGVRSLGVYRTIDGGDTWEPVNNGLTFVGAWPSTTTAHAITEKDVKLAISPHYERDHTVFAASSVGLFRTTDAGDSWGEVVSSGYNERSYIVGIALSPTYAKDETLIISVKGKGLFKSDNGGETFVAVGPELIANNHAIKLIEFSPAYARDNTVYAASEFELFESTDGGQTWEAIARPVRHEEGKEAVQYKGEWTKQWSDDFSARSISVSDVAYSKVTLSFLGTGVSWIGTQGRDQGIARVYVDGNYAGDVDQFSEGSASVVSSFSVTGLPHGAHRITVEVSDTKNPESTGYRVSIDAFDVVP